jgi:drug/metabolite transporter (DMT)-like permease
MTITFAKLSSASLATFGALLEGIGTILEKKTLRIKGVSYQNYITIGFLLIVLASIPVFLVLSSFFPQIFNWRIASEAFQLKNILIFTSVIIISVIANMFVYYAMKWEKITELEPIKLSQALFVIILAFIFYAAERQTISVIIPALIASLALIFSHFKRHHVQFNKYAMAAIAGSFFFALELVISRVLLDFYSPLTFYLLRCFFIFLIALIIFNKQIKNVNKTAWTYITITGFIWVIYRSILYYSYTLKGIIFTTLLFLLAPIFIYLFSYKYLNEKPNWRNIIASIIILLCVLYATFINGA